MVPSIALLFSPAVTLDGTFEQKMSWGKEFIPLAPGNHSIKCGLKLGDAYLVDSATYEFTVVDQTVIRIKWRAPLLFGLKGRWRNLGVLKAV